MSKNFDEWTNISLKNRNLLKENFIISDFEQVNRQISKKDKTQKFLFKTKDNNLIEAVFMEFKDRDSFTACISSQIGCKMKCSFCSTGKLKFIRNLNSQEIIEQIVFMQRITGKKFTNIVFMGQGEPLDNFDNLIASINIIRKAIGISIRNITVSTCGIIPKIKKLAELKLGINLAVSLHSVIQDKREFLMPIAKKYTLFSLINSLEYYFQKTKRRITFEYIMLKNVNDSLENALNFCDLLKEIKFACLINLIPYNNSEDEATCLYTGSNRSSIEKFKEIIERSGKKVTIRLSLGKDIKAACGQLQNFHKQF